MRTSWSLTETISFMLLKPDWNLILNSILGTMSRHIMLFTFQYICKAITLFAEQSTVILWQTNWNIPCFLHYYNQFHSLFHSCLRFLRTSRSTHIQTFHYVLSLMKPIAAFSPRSNSMSHLMCFRSQSVPTNFIVQYLLIADIHVSIPIHISIYQLVSYFSIVTDSLSARTHIVVIMSKELVMLLLV